MTIMEPDRIDFVAVKPNSSVVKLVIADHLTWADFEGHSRRLQDKINAYLEFVESGQLNRLQEPVIPESPDIRVTLAMQHKPTQEAMEFLGRVEAFLTNYKIKLELDAPPHEDQSG